MLNNNTLLKTNYSNDKFIHIIHEKDKLSKITKQYKEEIDNYVKLQKQKEEDLMKINRIELLFVQYLTANNYFITYLFPDG